MNGLQQNLPLLGRVLLGLLFVLSGIFKIPGWEPTLGFMNAAGVPLAALFLVGTIALEIVGGLALMVGYQARVAAAALALFSVVAAVLFHNFWAFSGFEQQAQMANFLKNFSIAGGLLLVVAFGPGARSVGADRFGKAAAMTS